MPAEQPNDLNRVAFNDELVFVSGLILFKEEASLYRVGLPGMDPDSKLSGGVKTLPKLMCEDHCLHPDFIRRHGIEYQYITVCMPRWMFVKLGIGYEATALSSVASSPPSPSSPIPQSAEPGVPDHE